MIMQELVGCCVYCVLRAEPLVYLTNIIQGLIGCFVLSVEGRALGVSDQDYARAGGLLCELCVGGIALCVSVQDYPRDGHVLCTEC